MINEHTSPQQFKHTREEGCTSNDMQDNLFHFKDHGWKIEFQCQKEKIFNFGYEN